MLKLRTSHAICSTRSPSIWPHPIFPDTWLQSSSQYIMRWKLQFVKNSIDVQNWPALIIGSIVKTCPAFITPTALLPANRSQGETCKKFGLTSVYVRNKPLRLLHLLDWLSYNKSSNVLCYTWHWLHINQSRATSVGDLQEILSSKDRHDLGLARALVGTGWSKKVRNDIKWFKRIRA